MDFAAAVKQQQKIVYTENGMQAKNTSENVLVDLYSTIGALRGADPIRVQTLFTSAYGADPLLATKILFYARDIRGGLGERKIFRDLIKYMAFHMPNALRPNLDLIGVYGRYDDLYSLKDTPLEKDMWDAMRKQWNEDLENYKAGNAVSLLGKWLKTPDASSETTRKLGIETALKLGMPVYTYKKNLRKLRERIRIVESLMSANKWDEIKYPEVPSRAMKIYKNAFSRHDAERFNQYALDAAAGKEKINSSTLYPYDILEGYMRSYHEDPIREAQWNQLPNYVQDGSNAIVIADTSGSMSGRPIHTAVGLAIYFAERNKGAYHNLWMNFSDSPSYQVLKGATLLQKLHNIDYSNWGANTNIEAAFELILKTALENHCTQEELPKAIIIISDMEFDICTRVGSGYYGGAADWSFYGEMEARFERAGYKIPSVIFWNVASRHDVFHADSERRGVQLVSGQSTTVFRQLMECVDFTPYEAMLKVINSERYDDITIG